MTIATILAEKGRHVVTAGPDTSLCEAASELMRHGIGALVIVNADNRFLGLIAERDIVLAIATGGAAALSEPVTEHMQSVTPASEKDSVNETMQVMTIERRRHIPVMREGALAGLVSIGDVVKYRLRVVEEEHRSMREYIAQA